jgi:hypothetical protein
MTKWLAATSWLITKVDHAGLVWVASSRRGERRGGKMNMESGPPHNPIERVEELHGPFRDEAEVMVDHAAQQDDISKTQSSGNAAVEVSADHVSALLYEPGYIWDPRSSPQGVEYYPESPGRREHDTRAEQA